MWASGIALQAQYMRRQMTREAAQATPAIARFAGVVSPFTAGAQVMLQSETERRLRKESLNFG